MLAGVYVIKSNYFLKYSFLLVHKMHLGSVSPKNLRSKETPDYYEYCTERVHAKEILVKYTIPAPQQPSTSLTYLHVTFIYGHLAWNKLIASSNEARRSTKSDRLCLDSILLQSTAMSYYGSVPMRKGDKT